MGIATNVVADTIDVLRRRGGLTGVDVANVADVSKATVSRWTTGKGSPQPRTQLVLSDLRYVVDRLAEFYSPDEARVWLYGKGEARPGRKMGHVNRLRALRD
jgi:phosphoribosylaminoimidazole carboxylase (NCAIR synthetase)